MALVRSLSPDPGDPLVTLRAADEVEFKLLAFSVKQRLVDEARSKGATWEEVGKFSVNQRLINPANEGRDGPDVPLTLSAAYGRYKRAGEQQGMPREMRRADGPEVFPGLGQREMAAKLGGISVNTVLRKVESGELIVKTFTSRRGKDHKRYFEKGDLPGES